MGIINPTGLYTAPAAVPSPAAVTVTATSQADSSVSGSAIVTIGPYNVKSQYSFTGLNDGAAPTTALVEGSDGYFCGTAALGGENGDGRLQDGFIGEHHHLTRVFGCRWRVPLMFRSLKAAVDFSTV